MCGLVYWEGVSDYDFRVDRLAEEVEEDDESPPPLLDLESEECDASDFLDERNEEANGV